MTRDQARSEQRRNLFERLSSRASPEATAALKEEARRFFAAGSEATVSVMEMDCADAACPGVETIVVVLEAGKRPQTARFQKRIVEVRKDDFDELAKSRAGGPPKRRRMKARLAMSVEPPF